MLGGILMDYSSFLSKNAKAKFYYRKHNLKPIHIDRVSRDNIVISCNSEVRSFTPNDFRLYLSDNNSWYFSNPSALSHFNFDIVRYLILYHGSIGGINGKVRVNYSSCLRDFGTGFYLGTDKMQATNRVCNEKDSFLYTYKLLVTNQTIYTFKDGLLWALYIAKNRGKFNFSNHKKLLEVFDFIDNHDIIVGIIADDKIARTYDYFINGSINSKVLLESLKLVRYGSQYVIKNQKYVSNKHLRLLEKHKLTKTERNNALSWGKQVKDDMLGSLEYIQKTYRRASDGYYFDEILDMIARGDLYGAK